MPKDVDEITIGANGSVFAAPLGSVIPADVETPLAGTWVDLGFLTEDGATITHGRTLENIPVWQLFYPARRVVTERDVTVAFTMRQFAGQQLEFALGGGVAQTAAGLYRLTPPAPEALNERMLAIEWSDGDKDYRFVVRRGIVVESVETNIVRTAAADLPITFGIIGEAGVDPWLLDTNDPGFLAAVG